VTQIMINTPGVRNNSKTYFSKPVEEIIQQRYSCRTYRKEALEEGMRRLLADYAASAKLGLFGTHARFELVAASEGDPQALKSLGTYGFIKHAAGFIVGAIKDHPYNLENFGYLLERIILYATDLDLGTCWLGGTFSKSSFAKKISIHDFELVPGVASVGYIAEKPRRIETIFRRTDGTDRRLPWERLFFDRRFDQPLQVAGLGGYKAALDMVRLGPSASNKQPWRIVKDGSCWHFYLRRTPGYRESMLVRLTTVADLQRMDIGIAMSHFELTAREQGLEGRWEILSPQIEIQDEFSEYKVSWVG
jgi:nitroreductase